MNLVHSTWNDRFLVCIVHTNNDFEIFSTDDGRNYCTGYMDLGQESK